jgi:hypothetical protein
MDKRVMVAVGILENFIAERITYLRREGRKAIIFTNIEFKKGGDHPPPKTTSYILKPKNVAMGLAMG